MVINPKCNQKDQIMNICLRHDGYVVPCCFLADIGVPWEKLKKLLGDKLEQIQTDNLMVYTLNVAKNKLATPSLAPSVCLVSEGI